MDQQKRGIILVAISGIFWGLSGTCGQYLMSDFGISAIWLTWFRMIVAGIILSAYSLLKARKSTKQLFQNKKSMGLLIIYVIFGICINQLSYLKAISHSNAGTATVLQYLGPIFIVIYVCVTNARLPKQVEIFSLSFALLGTFLLATHGNVHSLVISKVGLAWGLLAAFGMMFHSLLPRKLLEQYDAVVITGFGMLLGSLFFSIAFDIQPIEIALNVKTITALFGVAIGGTVISYTLYLEGIKYIGPVKGSLVASVEPVAAVVFSWSLLGTRVTWMDTFGVTLILGAVIALSIEKEGNIRIDEQVIERN